MMETVWIKEIEQWISGDFDFCRACFDWIIET